VRRAEGRSAYLEPGRGKERPPSRAAPGRMSCTGPGHSGQPGSETSLPFLSAFGIAGSREEIIKADLQLIGVGAWLALLLGAPVRAIGDLSGTYERKLRCATTAGGTTCETRQEVAVEVVDRGNRARPGDPVGYPECRRNVPMTDFRSSVRFGQTDLRVSRLGIGSSFTRDSAVIEEAVERGVNYLYWGSIRRPAFGRAMRNVARKNRESVVLTVQSYSRVAALLAPSVELALRRAALDYFDFLLLGKWDKPPGPALVDAAERLKQRGRVRHLMMSTHNRPSLQGHFRDFAAGESAFDAFMLRYNAVHRGAERDVFPYLPCSPPGSAGPPGPPGIVAYTATRWGHLLDPGKMPPGEEPPRSRDCYRFALSHAAVSVVLCGPSNREEMQEALLALDAGPLSPEEMARMQRIGDHVAAQYKPQFVDKGDARLDAAVG
jgi:aryl-alcohol dehydrogenase-like predicted oxidoreductase